MSKNRDKFFKDTFLRGYILPVNKKFGMSNEIPLNFEGYSGDTGLWIGGNDIADKGHWVWTDGEPLNVEMTEKIDKSVVGHCLQADLNSNSLKSAACASTAVRRTAFVALESGLNFNLHD